MRRIHAGKNGAIDFNLTLLALVAGLVVAVTYKTSHCIIDASLAVGCAVSICIVVTVAVGVKAYEGFVRSFGSSQAAIQIVESRFTIALKVFSALLGEVTAIIAVFDFGFTLLKLRLWALCLGASDLVALVVLVFGKIVFFRPCMEKGRVGEGLHESK